MKKQLRDIRLFSDMKFNSAVVKAPFKYYRMGRVSRVWTIDRKYWELLKGLGYTGWELVDKV